MTISTSYKRNSIKSLLLMHEHLMVLTTSKEKDILVKIFSTFFLIQNIRRFLFVQTFIFLTYEHFPTLYTCDRHVQTQWRLVRLL